MSISELCGFLIWKGLWVPFARVDICPCYPYLLRTLQAQQTGRAVTGFPK
jgi:hypothetical protein